MTRRHRGQHSDPEVLGVDGQRQLQFRLALSKSWLELCEEVADLCEDLDPSGGYRGKTDSKLERW